ncbi:dephospho-CoA kinase [Macrococcus epidermidis]|uniref:Dephospho-CoA kinase n=1 Tax=Macrococcus epidermidis TaxID=1902580 RepID=A0A327ZYA7_9STAP|nr:dephospho-CoA kinase [Macrococcus epidermidis]MCG7419703.1 dephospho-CoA kinase [Macrococcus epidermidis]RAK47056.1 dephospho-CoA kinase [Macrococcus epidermidis]
MSKVGVSVTVIGLTGGIASGKSTVANFLSENGFVIVDADIASRKAVEAGSSGLEEIRTVFGDGVIQEDGTLNRKALGEIIFKDKNQREKLNAIVHPRVRDIMEAEKEAGLALDKPVVMDIPLLFENKLEHTVDEVWVVYVPKEVQIERLMARNQLSLEEAESRVSSQLSIEEKKQKADKVIDNSGSLQSLYQQLELLIQSYI